jgi:hypothetical protein
LEVMMGISFLNGVLLNWRRTGQDIALRLCWKVDDIVCEVGLCV